MTVQNKTILNINDVFSLIQYNKHHQITASHVTLPSGQIVPLSKNLKRIHALGHELTCSVCGCHGTHLQQYFQYDTKTKIKTELWRVMTWSNAGNRISFLNLDHIVAQANGGTWDLENLRVTCEYCNVARGSHPISAEPQGFTIGMIMQHFNSTLKIKKKPAKLKILKKCLVKRLHELKLSCKKIAASILFPLVKSILPRIGVEPKDELFEGLLPA